MSERIDHYSAAIEMLKDAQVAKDLAMVAVIADGAQVHATLALVEQQRIANLIALAKTAQEHYGGYAGEAGFVRTLFDNPNTELGNMRLKPNIAAALGLTAGQEGDNDEG